MKYSCTILVPQSPPELILVPFFIRSKVAHHPLLQSLVAGDRSYIEKVAKAVTRDLELHKVIVPSAETRILLMCLGDKASWSPRKYCRAVRKLFQAVKNTHVKSCSILLSDLKVPDLGIDRFAELFAINAELAVYEFDLYRAEQEGWENVQVRVTAFERRDVVRISRALNHGAIIGEQTNATRDLANIPGGDMTPKLLASRARRMGKKSGVVTKVLGKTEMEKLGMGAILGVARGSAEEPQFIIMEYFGAAKSQKPIVYVGKGVTFDTGGINLKPSHGFDEMHMDMAGGAAVISAVCAIARLGCKLNVVGIVPAVENMPSGSSYRPGDILRSMSGKTIEIRNTDAEGRVILSDALTYSERYHPSLVVDIATLTGACMVALGDHAFAVLSPSDELAEKIKLLGEVSGDYCWPLPLWEEYEHDVRGTIGDVSNAAKNHPRGGTINAACFLQEFSKAFPKWAHLDIASTMTSVPSQYLAPGATGTGTRILIEIARSR